MESGVDHLNLLLKVRVGDVHHVNQQVRFAHLVHVVVARGGRSLVDVAHVEHGFRGEEEEALSGLLFLAGLELHAAGTLALEQCLAVGRQYAVLRLCVLVAAHLGNLLHALDAVLHRLEVLQLELRVDDFLVAHGVYRTVHVYDVAVVEAAEHVDDGVRLADVAEELVAEAFAFRRALHEARDVHDFHRGRHDASGVDQLGEFRESFVGHGDDAHVGLDGAEGEVGRLCLGITQAVEQGGLAHVGQAHNAAL